LRTKQHFFPNLIFAKNRNTSEFLLTAASSWYVRSFDFSLRVVCLLCVLLNVCLGFLVASLGWVLAECLIYVFFGVWVPDLHARHRSSAGLWEPASREGPSGARRSSR
jgi:hypothetical protein